jgi:hypothetical protein
MNIKEAKERFESKVVGGSQPARIQAIRDAYADLAETVALKCLSERELALAMTKLEESCMWAIKSISRK